MFLLIRNLRYSNINSIIKKLLSKSLGNWVHLTGPLKMMINILGKERERSEASSSLKMDRFTKENGILKPIQEMAGAS